MSKDKLEACGKCGGTIFYATELWSHRGEGSRLPYDLLVCLSCRKEQIVPFCDAGPAITTAALQKHEAERMEKKVKPTETTGLIGNVKTLMGARPMGGVIDKALSVLQEQVSSRFKVGQWVRFKFGSDPVVLGRVQEDYTVESAHGFHCLSDDMRPALPRDGETWKVECASRHHVEKMPTKWEYAAAGGSIAHLWEQERITCGCLAPVNFGKG